MYRVDVAGASRQDVHWAANGLRYHTQAEALAAAKDLYRRWTGMKGYRIVPDEVPLGQEITEADREALLVSPEVPYVPEAGPDIEVQNEGTIFILHACTTEGAKWIGEKVTITGETQFWAGGVVVEHRYIADIVEGARGDGLHVK